MPRKIGVFLLLLCFLAGCGLERPPLKIQSSPPTESGKKVIMMIVDSLLAEPLRTLMDQNKLPAFSFLKENGVYIDKMISSFPTMSVNIDSTLLTGAYADKHHIPGLRWYDVHAQRMVSYGDGPKSVMKLGAKQVLTDSLYRLNNEHLSQKEQTIHEELSKKGYSTASVNALVYRGDTKQTLHVPTPFEDIQTMAPAYFVLGSFHHYLTMNPKDQFLKYYGINDQMSVEHIIQLLDHNQLPHFTLAYLPDLDHETHKAGRNPTDAVIEADRKLQQILNRYPSWQEAIKQHVFIVMGDSGVSKVKEDKTEALIDLEQLLSPLKNVALGEKPTAADSLAIATNERMAYLYLLENQLDETVLLEKLAMEPRIDTVSWKDGEWIEVVQADSQKRMRFRPGNTFTDPFQQRWEIDGDREVLDLRVDTDRHDQRLAYGRYPDGLMHLYSASQSHPGRYMIVTAKPGYELIDADSPYHVGGGAHGSFHEQDVLFPLFIAGTDKKLRTWRIVDLKSFILDVVEGK
ncbi:hypothetical protein BEP19_00960 [Ammoniphilus oxalaticus]|uniref:Phosphodiesterase n=1 Tax=Ammoniphilus oxalaticus TaxID=66863 RepID=A0A419SMN6_9BACL|nr:alkaline phosphatase family protein [Ammoniphilus oxalaticus]RKD25545.1 hypothetical protein BEP19_00960 [Ammoniphilus oxalaticus]